MLGLLARGLAVIAPRGGLEGWRWIFIIEGLLVSQQPHFILKFQLIILYVDRRLRCTEFPPSSKLIGVGIVLDERRKRLWTRETSHG